MAMNNQQQLYVTTDMTITQTKEFLKVWARNRGRS